MILRLTIIGYRRSYAIAYSSIWLFCLYTDLLALQRTSLPRPDSAPLGRAGGRRIGAVVVTDSASVNADQDNGTVALYGAPRLRGRDRGTAHRVGGARSVRRRSQGQA